LEDFLEVCLFVAVLEEENDESDLDQFIKKDLLQRLRDLDALEASSNEEIQSIYQSKISAGHIQNDHQSTNVLYGSVLIDT
jgi:tellurite resistance protein